jgi:hypothetical protein
MKNIQKSKAKARYFFIFSLFFFIFASKGLSHRLSLAKSGMVGQAKIGEEPLGFSKIFQSSFDLHVINVNRNAALKRKGMENGNCHVFADSCWAILPSLLLAVRGYLGISQRRFYTL